MSSTACCVDCIPAPARQRGSREEGRPDPLSSCAKDRASRTRSSGPRRARSAAGGAAAAPATPGAPAGPTAEVEAEAEAEVEAPGRARERARSLEATSETSARESETPAVSSAAGPDCLNEEKPGT